MNTRRYPRTLNEAFPQTPEYASSVERPFDREDRIVMWGCVLTAVACLLIWLWR